MAGSLITNDEKTLASLLNDTIDNSKNIDILVGYFYFSGFAEIHNKINSHKVRILVGLDVDVDAMNIAREYERLDHKRHLSAQRNRDEYFSQFVKLFNNTNIFDTKEKQDAFKIFYDKIKDGSLEIRKTKEPNHAKLYLFEATNDFSQTLPGHMIVGSSNLSITGLKTRNELNVVFHDEDYNKGKELFDRLWEDAIVIANKDIIQEFDEKVIKKIWFEKLPSPYAVYLRVLDEYFGNLGNITNFKSPNTINNKYSDLEYQVDAIKEAIDKIERHNGVIIADVVGLGKSIIASAIAANLNIPTVIITPPHLKNQWEDYSHEFGFYTNSHIYTSGKIEEALRYYGEINQKCLIIVDEAHKYRNSKNKDYLMLHSLCSGNKVVLLTATPYNNRPQDIYNLLKLFQIPGKSTLRNMYSFHTLIDEYRRLEIKAKKSDADLESFKINAARIAKKILNIISPIIIRRSRLDLLSITRYKKDLEKQHISFPKVKDPEILEYNLGDMKDLYLSTLDSIYANKEENPNSYKAARYIPLQYIKQEAIPNIKKQLETNGFEDLDFFQRSQSNLAEFMRRLLVHRFESSIFAFQKSLENMILISTNILKWIDKRKKIPVYKRGYLPDIDTFINSTDDNHIEFDELETQIQRLETNGLFEIDINFISDSFIEDVKKDMQLLKEIYDNWFGFNGKIKKDPKVEELILLIKEKLKKEKNRKIVIFSEFGDTVDYLYSKLSEAKIKVFHYTSKISSESNKKIIRTNFDAGINEIEQKNDFDVLIATDAIAEGYNLHRAGTIFNYDIPYNPTKVIQRIGRINRINKKVFDELYIYNYFPSYIGEKDIKVQKIATLKMKMIHAIMGGDMKVLQNDEELFLSEFNKKFREIENNSENKSWDTDYREEWELAKKMNIPEYEEALSIPYRTKIKRNTFNNTEGVLLFGKKGKECIFKYIKNEEEPVTLLPEEAIPYFKAGKEEKSYKTSNVFENLYQIVSNDLFKDTKNTIRPQQAKAINRIKAWKNSGIINEDYFDDLLELMKLDALPDYSIVVNAKRPEEIKSKISKYFIEKTLLTSEYISESPENIIFAEELN